MLGIIQDVLIRLAASRKRVKSKVGKSDIRGTFNNKKKKGVTVIKIVRATT